MTNTTTTLEKIINLHTALNDCGIDAKLSVENGEVILTSNLWNCVDGSDVEFTVVANAEGIEHYADPSSMDDKTFSECKNFVATVCAILETKQ